MTYINVSITINEEKIRDQAIKAYKALREAIEQRYREIYDRAKTTGERHGEAPIVAGVHKLLNHVSVKHMRCDHTILSPNPCRRCRPLNIRTYCRRIKQV